MKTLTPVAQCAKAIRQLLKAKYPSVKFSVQSENFSMGNSVNVEWVGGPEKRQVEDLLAKYEYGHFNGMEDYYEVSNRRDDIPQTKYLFCSRRAVGFQYSATVADLRF